MPYSTSISFHSEPLEWKYSRYRSSRNNHWSVQFCFMCSTCIFIFIVVGLMHYQILQHEWHAFTHSATSSSNIFVVDPKVVSLRNGVRVSGGGNDNERVTITTKIVNGKLQKTITRGATKMVIHGTNEDVLNRYIEHALAKQQPTTSAQSQSTSVTLRQQSTTSTSSTHTVTGTVTFTKSGQRIVTMGTTADQNSAIAAAATSAPTFEEPAIAEIPRCQYENLVIAGIDPNQDIPKVFPSRNLILGIAANIDIRNFAIFCGSLRNSGINATTILFMNEFIPKEHGKIAREFNVILLVYDRKQLQPKFIRTYHPSSLRWILFDWFFTIRNGSYTQHFDRILALDVRDSAFQSDPFNLFHFQPSLFVPSVSKSPLVNNINKNNLQASFSSSTTSTSSSVSLTHDTTDHNTLYVFGENRFIAISTCNWNSGWIRDCFGERIYNLVKDQPISCSGISMGGITRMMEYFNKMSQILLNNFPCLASSTLFPTCERNGVDQGVHNVLLHLQYLSPVIVKYSDDFPIVNLQSSPDLMMDKSLLTTTSTTSTGMKIISSSSAATTTTATTTKGNQREPAIYMTKYPGVKYAVVHQYDRDGTYQLLLGKKYLPSIDWDSPIADWAQTEACTANFGVVFGADFLRGKCDSGASRGMTPAACCSACMHQRHSMLEKNLTIKACTAFTFLDGVCYLKHCPEKEVKLLVSLISDPNFKDVTMTNLKAVSGYFKSTPI